MGLRSARRSGRRRVPPSGAPRRAAHGAARVPRPAAPSLAAARPAAGRWLLRGKDGRLTAYALAPGAVLRWTETRPGGPEWSGPDVFPLPGADNLAVAQGGDGYAHLVARCSRPGPEGGAEVDLAHATQFQSGRPLVAWRRVDNPHEEPELAARLGVPTAAVGADGALHVFVRNAGGGVFALRQGAAGEWAQWEDIRGWRVLGVMAAVATGAGRVELLAPAETSVLRWCQPTPRGAFARAEDVPAVPHDGSAVALETGPDRLTYYWSDAERGGLVAHRPGEGTFALGGTPGGGPLSVVRAEVDGHDCTVLAHRGADGRPTLGAWVTGAEAGGVWWTATGEGCVGHPALAADAFGRLVLAALGTDGTLRVTRQRPERGLALEAWRRA
ncbi:hypothetical protein MOV08_28985 [Streptomyces yunnanensis]|uniref:Uncharacterized protein n=1 Tax=Streptomyces yunnanensis TaxID=156453 RepID=A0ABY8ADT7_9ACTN|nr:hypothetical protein [Streptomyces yunnanensis]WEB42889.1 hypothetical protein MOV08_28985 [Streptomyces yunnanensis]